MADGHLGEGAGQPLPPQKPEKAQGVWGLFQLRGHQSALIQHLVRGPMGEGRPPNMWGLTDGNGGASVSSTQQPNQTEMET